MFVVTDPKADLDAVQDAVQKVAEAANPLANVQSNQEVIDDISGQINSVVYPLYALLAVIVVISIVGIINTLLLSVFERTREIGLLRAVGTTRRQVRRMVRYESVITSVIGATLGVVVGVVFGGMVIYRIDEIPFAFPTGQIIIFFIVAIIAGVLAAILPARRASRLDVLRHCSTSDDAEVPGTRGTWRDVPSPGGRRMASGDRASSEAFCGGSRE